MKKFKFSFSKVILPAFLVGTFFGVTVTVAGAALKGSAIFRDVHAGHYADQAIGDAFADGVLKGYDSTHFGPDDPVTRGQLSLILVRLGLVDGTSAPVSTSSSRSSSSSSSSSVSSSLSSSSSSYSSTPFNEKGKFRMALRNENVEENNALGKISVVVVREGNNGAVAVKLTSIDGTAIAGTDYEKVDTVINFANKETSKKVDVVIKDNGTASQPNKTFQLKLSAPTNGSEIGDPSTETITIIDNETAGAGSSSSSSAAPTTAIMNFSAVGYGVMENGGSVTINVVRSGVTSSAVSVNYTTADGTGHGGGEFNATSGTLNFGANETSKSFTVSINNNGSLDGNRNFSVMLSSPSAGASLGTATNSLVTINDDEIGAFTGSGTVKFSLSLYDASEGQTAKITVSHAGGVGAFNVGYSTTNGSAISPADYTSVSGTLNFAAGEVSKTFDVPIMTDSLASEDMETITLTLSSPTNGVSLGDPSTATLRISQ